MLGQVVMSVKTNVVLSALVGVIALSAPNAGAAPATSFRDTAKVAEVAQPRPVAVTESDEDSAACSRSRKRLWLEGEGWVVRKVTTCR